MKIRIKGNTVRYRLTKQEVAALTETGWLEERTDPAGGTLLYVLTRTDSKTLSAHFTENTVTLYVPDTELHQWANSDATGIDGKICLHNGTSLYLLLEKDVSA